MTSFSLDYTMENLPAENRDIPPTQGKQWMLEVGFMTDLLWFFWIYSFGGYLVERAFAAATRAERR